MDVLRYALSELGFRSGRSLVTVTSVALAVLAAMILTALADSYARAIRVPIETVGADVVVQLQGDIPPKLEGLVFPHPNALIPASIVTQIHAVPGVIGLTRAVYLWDLEPARYESILGIEDGDAGLAGLARRLIDGKAIDAKSRAVLIDSDFATKNRISLGSTIKVGSETFPVAGIVDAARSGKIVRADVYTSLAVAQALATVAREVRALYPFGPDDANLVLVKVNREQLQAVVGKITTLLGKKGVVSSELSMREALSGVLFLSQSMGLIIAASIGVFAAAFVWRATASSVAARRREMAVLQAVGWSWRHIRRQVLLENVALAIAGAAAGLILALGIAAALGHITVTVDLPWDLSSTPHFIPQAAINRTQIITSPVSISWPLATLTAAGGIAISALAALAVLALPQQRPWALLRSE